MSFMLNEYAFDFDRYCLMRDEIISKNNSGFNLSIPNNVCSANYGLNFNKFGYLSKTNRLINPYRLGFENPYVKTHFSIPYGVTGITEAQKYFNSRMSKYFPRWQSEYYEQHGHNNLDFFLDTQRPMLIDVNIRELSTFTEILKMYIERNKFGWISKVIWIVRDIPNSQTFDCYMESGKRDKTCYIEREVIANYNCLDIYDSQSCKPKFYNGHLYNDFDIDYYEPTEESLEGYIKYLEKNDDELPENFYLIGKKNNDKRIITEV